MKYFSFLIVAGAVFISACRNGSNSPKSARDLMELAAPNMNAGADKFVIESPAEWRRVDTALNGVKTTILLSDKVTDGFRSNVNIVTERMENSSLQEYFDNTVNGLAHYVEKFTVIDQGDKEINGNPSKWLKYTAVQGGRNVAAILYVIPQNGIAYGITGICNATGQAKDFPLFEQAVSTFKVKE